MEGKLVVVKAAFDAEADVWFVESSDDLHGLNVEAATLEELLKKLPGAVADLLEAEGFDAESAEVPIELIAHARTRTRLGNRAA
jgi:hypothetical protein